MKYFSILEPIKNDVRFEYFPWKNTWFCFMLFLFGFNLILKLRNFDFESHSNTLIFFDKKWYDVRFGYVPWKNVWFCFISVVWVHFRRKTKSFWFWKPLKYFYFFKKNDVRFEYFLSNKVWFGLSFFVSVELWQ